MWSAIDDSRVRPSHLAMDGYIAHVDDPLWKIWHPPAGYNCRCTQIALTEKQAIARGYGKQARPDVQPDPGFGSSSVTEGLRGAIQARKAACNAFDFAGTRKDPPIWCKGEGELSLERIERSLLNHFRLDQPPVLAIAEFALNAVSGASHHALLRFAPVVNAARIHELTGIVAVGYEHVLDSYGVRHAIKGHGPDGTQLRREQRPITTHDFARVPEIVANPDRMLDAGTSEPYWTPANTLH